MLFATLSDFFALIYHWKVEDLEKQRVKEANSGRSRNMSSWVYSSDGGVWRISVYTSSTPLHTSSVSQLQLTILALVLHFEFAGYP